MSLDLLRKVFRFRQPRKSALLRRSRLGSGFNVPFEPLEERQLLTVSTAYVDSQWALTTDNSPTGVLNTGDLVNDTTNLSGGPFTYGSQAFGTVTSGSPTGSVSGDSLINNAISNTTSGGQVDVASGSYGDNTVSVTSPLLLQGAYTLSGTSAALHLDNASAILSPSANQSTGTPTPGTISLSGSSSSLNLEAGTLAVEIDSTGASDEISTSGSVTLGGSSPGDGVNLEVNFGDTAATSGTFTIINNQGSGAISGTFAGLPEGATITTREQTFTISYTGGTGNDVVLTLASQIPFASYVDDNWLDTTTGTTPSVPGMGDSVSNQPSETNLGPVATHYGTITTSPVNNEGFNNIATAVSATGPGGSVNILPGTYTGNVNVSSPLSLVGAYTLNSDLTLSNSQASLSTGSTPGTLNVNNLTFASGVKVTMNLDPSGTSDQINVSGTATLNGATLKLNMVGSATSNLTLISTTGGVSGTFAGLPEGSQITLGKHVQVNPDGTSTTGPQTFWITYQGGASGHDVDLVPAVSSVAGQFLFYNQSKFDGNTAGVSSSDDSAIATDKTALVASPSGATQATFANLSSYSKGINGIMVDVSGSHGTISASDFLFRVGSNNAPSSWSTLSTAPTVSVRTGAGVSGSNRVELIWPNNTIDDEWLQVTVLSTINTRLTTPNVFYFGNLIGDTGDGDTTNLAVTNSTDQIGARNNPGNNEPVTDVYDFDRNGVVNATDELIARDNNFTLHYISITAPPTIGSFSIPPTMTPGTSVTLQAYNVTDPSGTLTGVNFYQDTNGNGVYDPSDTLLATGTEGLTSGVPNGNWSGTFDPAVLGTGPTTILIVPVNGNGAMTTGTRASTQAAPATGRVSLQLDFNDGLYSSSTVGGYGYAAPNFMFQPLGSAGDMKVDNEMGGLASSSDDILSGSVSGQTTDPIDTAASATANSPWNWATITYGDAGTIYGSLAAHTQAAVEGNDEYDAIHGPESPGGPNDVAIAGFSATSGTLSIGDGVAYRVTGTTADGTAPLPAGTPVTLTVAANVAGDKQETGDDKAISTDVSYHIYFTSTDGDPIEGIANGTDDEAREEKYSTVQAVVGEVIGVTFAVQATSGIDSTLDTNDETSNFEDGAWTAIENMTYDVVIGSGGGV